MASPSQKSNSQKLENPVAVDKAARVSPADVGLPFWPALEGSQVDRSVAPAAYFIARINHESNSFLRLVVWVFSFTFWQFWRFWQPLFSCVGNGERPSAPDLFPIY